MRKAKRWLLMSAVLLLLVSLASAGAPFKKVSLATSTTTTSTTTTEAPPTTGTAAEDAKSNNETLSSPTKNSKLTGIPQIDYIWDPNLPHELHGYNLSSYPFFSTVPPNEDIHFKCDGLHDGFYAAIEFKCQVYHHCVYGIRHDFLCANFTAFDQRTFICHFVSDVDCEGSQKYWSRNDALYMATTTSSTTTTTTEPPPAPRRRHPARPLRPRRPSNYYYDEEDYDDDYYEDRLNRRRKARPRHRKPVNDYDDDYDEERALSDDDKPRRPLQRDRVHDNDEQEDDYENVGRRKYDRPRTRSKPTERRKSSARKPNPLLGRPSADERRSFGDDRPSGARKEKPKPLSDDEDEPVDAPPPRRLAGRRRINEKRTSPAPATDLDELDEYEKPQDQDEAAGEESPPKVKTTPKPLEEFITPKAAPSSVFSRPRAPPRIARPVPVNEKKKFQYPVQKTATTPNPDTVRSSDDYYEDEEYEDVRGHPGRPRKRVVEDKFEDVDEQPPPKRRNQNDSRKPVRTTIRKPIVNKKHIPAEEDEYDNVSSENVRSSGRKRPYSNRPRSSIPATSGRGADEVDFVDDDYEERPLRPQHRLRPKAAARKGVKRPRLPPVDEEEEEDLYEPEPDLQPLRGRAGSSSRKNTPSARLRQTAPSVAADSEGSAEDESPVPASLSSSKTASTSPAGRSPSVRVVKRPFLPSRGGSPYLPRGLQPVGVAMRSLSAPTTDSTPIDMGSTISGVRLLEHGAPLLRDSGSEHEREPTQGPLRTTLPPRSAIPVSEARPEPQPKITLDELYENDYDVTLNDALNPTLKPLSPHQSHHLSNRNYPNAFASAPAAEPFVNNNQSPALYHNNNNNNNNNYQQQHQNAYQSVPPHQSQTIQTHHQQPQQHQHQQQQQSPQQQALNSYNSDDSYFSSTDIRRRAIVPAPLPQSGRTDYRGVGMRIAQHFYDDLEY